MLDIGTGPGQIPISLAKLNIFSNIVAIDVAPEILEQAKRNAEQAGVVNKIKFEQADIEQKLSFADESFDVVVCHNTLHHCADPHFTIQEMERVLKKDGVLLVRDVFRFNLIILRAYIVILSMFITEARRQYIESLNAALSYKEWRQLAKQHGATLRRHFITHVSLEKGVGKITRQSVAKQPTLWLIRLIRRVYI